MAHKLNSRMTDLAYALNSTPFNSRITLNSHMIDSEYEERQNERMK